MKCLTVYESPIGKLYIVCDEEALLELSFDMPKDMGKEEYKDGDKLDISREVIRWLDIYFSGKDPDFMPKMKVNGTPFFLSVSEAMRSIPFGRLMTYGDIAKYSSKKLGKEKMSAQAVGGACHNNPIAIIIPCHRVVGAGGRLTGYGGGLDKKIFLLENEGLKIVDEKVKL